MPIGCVRTAHHWWLRVARGRRLRAAWRLLLASCCLSTVTPSQRACLHVPSPRSLCWPARTQQQWRRQTVRRRATSGARSRAAPPTRLAASAPWAAPRRRQAAHGAARSHALRRADALAAGCWARPACAALLDLALWKEPQRSGAVLGGATLVFFVFEKLRYTTLALLSQALLVVLLGSFLWSAYCRFTNKCVRGARGASARGAARATTRDATRGATAGRCARTGRRRRSPSSRCPRRRCARPSARRWWPRTARWRSCTS